MRRPDLGLRFRLVVKWRSGIRSASPRYDTPPRPFLSAVISWSKQRAEAFKALSPFNLFPVWASVKEAEGVKAALVLMSKLDSSQPPSVCLKGRLEPQTCLKCH
ncbi:hypothetical protein GOODEAATRI_008196 [Goodea atripinnis]|uniref:Uncharacterized protein n=1 Tax=Goodea atripinnis TaxID=208336 RepID=A0ABV0P2D9_9TELE